LWVLLGAAITGRCGQSDEHGCHVAAQRAAPLEVCTADVFLCIWQSGSGVGVLVQLHRVGRIPVRRGPCPCPLAYLAHGRCRSTAEWYAACRLSFAQASSKASDAPARSPGASSSWRPTPPSTPGAAPAQGRPAAGGAQGAVLRKAVKASSLSPGVIVEPFMCDRTGAASARSPAH